VRTCLPPKHALLLKRGQASCVGSATTDCQEWVEKICHQDIAQGTRLATYEECRIGADDGGAHPSPPSRQQTDRRIEFQLMFSGTEK
jgi:hypothetical protein